MADSKKNEAQADAQNPPDALTVVLRNPDGSPRTQLRGKGGQFVRKPKPLIPTVEFVRERRKRLAGIRKDTGRFDGMTESRAIMEELLDFMHMPIHYDEKTGLPDSKHMSAKVQAFEAIMLFSEGKPAPSEQELNKLERAPFDIVYIPVPQIMHPEVQEYKPVDENKQPTFADGKKDIPIADAEVIQQNKK